MFVQAGRAALPALLLIASPSLAAADAAPAAVAGSLAPEARPAAAVVDAFHAALRRGDTAAALAFLAEDALVFEEGGAERGRAEYAASHVAADAAFSQAVNAATTRRAGSAAGSTAWVATEARSTGTFRGRAIDRIVAETMVLRRAAGSWKIVHIHWSSGDPKAP